MALSCNIEPLNEQEKELREKVWVGLLLGFLITLILTMGLLLFKKLFE